ncbi:MAG: sensor histidine kinase, partial [Treponema sp.]|nr:sensor histidine kinase [Treponema sp.]
EIWYNNSITPDGKNLIIADENGKGFWYYDFESKSEEYFESKAELEATRTKFQKQNSIKLAIKSNRLLLLLIITALLLIMLILISLIILLSFKIKKAVENTNLRKAEQIKNRNKFIFQIQEKERAKISRDIHDSVVQDIRVIRLETENLEINEQSREKQQFIQNTATSCIAKLRNICYNLQPAEIYTHSDGDSSKIELISIINTLSQQFISKTHIPCIVKVEDNFEYPVLKQEVTENLFRTIQEALTNIEKHSYATEVSIYFKTKIIENKKILQIYISDDGVGCNLETIKKRNKDEHRGLQNMKDRMELISGSMEIFSNPDEGMEIKLSLPLEK